MRRYRGGFLSCRMKPLCTFALGGAGVLILVVLLAGTDCQQVSRGATCRKLLYNKNE